MAKAKAKSGMKRAPAKRRPRKAKPGTRGLTPAESRLESLSGVAQEVAERIDSVGGQLLGSYSDPLGKQPVLVAILPIESGEPTPFQRDLAWQILALNTEKAHNLREKSLEVIRIYRGLIDEDAKRSESGFAYYLEEASLVTMGICYERNGKFAGGAYNPIVRRLKKFSD